MHELTGQQIEVVRPLFAAPYMSLVFDAVAAGNSPGRLWVDDPACLKTALLWDRGMRYYFAGDESNSEVNAVLSQLISQETTVGESPFVVIYCDTEGWAEQLGAMFPNRNFTQRQRRLYKLGQVEINGWQERVPAGFSLVRIDEALLTSRVANADRVVEEISSMWGETARFYEKGFGYCMLRGDEIVCWCTAEYISGPECGIGIETIEEYQGQGLATVTAGAFVDYCLANSISPHWDAWCSNLLSTKVAEKAGFEAVLEYAVYLGK